MLLQGQWREGVSEESGAGDRGLRMDRERGWGLGQLGW